MAGLGSGEGTLRVGDRVYTLALKTLGLMRLQQRFSTADTLQQVDAIIGRAMAGDLEAAVGIFWAALLKHHPEMTFDEAVELIDEAGQDAVGEAMAGLYASSTPDPEDLAEMSRPPLAQVRRGRGGVSKLPRAVSA